MFEIDHKTVKDLIPYRKAISHKGDYGTLLSVCGSASYRGAAVMSSLAAVRCGVGILKLASVEEVCTALAANAPEATYSVVPADPTGAIERVDIEALLEAFPNISAVLCGCGLTVTHSTKTLVLDIIRAAGCALVLDADALNCLIDRAGFLSLAKKTPIITPHLGEFSRLTGKTIDELKADPEGNALDFARRNNCVVVLKSNYTIVAAPDGRCGVSHLGNPGLAKGGSGDVLAGMISSFAAQGLDPFDAATLGVYVHGAAADLCAREYGMISMIPSDLIKHIPSVLKEFER